jgi:RNA polymerase sigma factor (TIGR02999 family)
MSEVTRVLSAIEHGDAHSASQLLPLVYNELRKLAARKLASERPGQTIQATALVHEAYLQLVGGSAAQAWSGRSHFFAAAATAMRRILIERARRKHRQIHGSELQRRRLRPDIAAAIEPHDDLIALDDALAKFAGQDPLKAKLVELRYFAGLTGEETAKVLGISASTVDRHWTYARAWLHREMQCATLS